ncbi:MAG: hypothetical protein IPN48_04990 [Sphingomonadales bacterium]|nr:hypothetical protein [Sphingomonadales bacterium]
MLYAEKLKAAGVPVDGCCSGDNTWFFSMFRALRRLDVSWGSAGFQGTFWQGVRRVTFLAAPQELHDLAFQLRIGVDTLMRRNALCPRLPRDGGESVGVNPVEFPPGAKAWRGMIPKLGQAFQNTPCHRFFNQTFEKMGPTCKVIG